VLRRGNSRLGGRRRRAPGRAQVGGGDGDDEECLDPPRSVTIGI
jgi:hypothetical protein